MGNITTKFFNNVFKEIGFVTKNGSARNSNFENL